MQRDFLPSLLKPSKRMEIQEISGETQKLVPSRSLFILPQTRGLLAPPLESQTLEGKKTLPLSLGTTESAAPGERGRRKAKVSCAEALGRDNRASSGREPQGRGSLDSPIRAETKAWKYSKAMQRRGPRAS